VRKNIFCVFMLLLLGITLLMSSASADIECNKREPYKVEGVVDSIYCSSDEKTFVFFRDDDVCYEFVNTCASDYRKLEKSEEKGEQITVYYESTENGKEIVVVHVGNNGIDISTMFFICAVVFIVSVLGGVVIGALG